MARTGLLLEPLSGSSIRRQEMILIPLNLALLAGSALFHSLFAPTIPLPPALLFVLLLGRFAIQAVELAWLAAGDIPDTVLRVYGHVPIWLNLAFAFTVSRLSPVVDSHYLVLMLLPVIAAAVRYRPAGIALVVAAAAGATSLQVWLYFRSRGLGADVAEYFEASHVALIYVTVAVVVALLARQLRSEQSDLRASLHELERTRDRLVERERLAVAGRLASAVAHEIRNPVAMISSSLALRRRGGGGLSDDELGHILEQELGRLERLTSDFLSYARQRPPDRRVAPLAPALGAASDLARARAGEKRVGITVDCAEELAAELDGYQIQQALLNLLANAIDAGPEGSQVVVSARASGADLVIEVVGTGAPIPIQDLDRIFEPFFSTKKGGTGLGLAITRSIAQAHGGDLEVRVNRPGEVGFRLTLTGAVRPAPAPAEEIPCPAS
jgi:signal transduction histidine kinase